jgi:hypothetical protein
VGVGKQGAACGKPVQVGSLHLRVPGQAANPVIQVIDGKENTLAFVSAKRGPLKKLNKSKHIKYSFICFTLDDFL